MQQQDMVNIDWGGYKPGLRASEWYDLFINNASDARGKLTWRDRLGIRPTTTYYNFYSQGDQVLEPQPYNDTLTAGAWAMYKESGRYAWALSEKYKGRLPIEWMLGSGYGGWRFNDDYYSEDTMSDGSTMQIRPMRIADADALTDEELRAMPFFQFNTADATALLDPNTGSQYAMLNRDRLLSESFPALTYPAGRNRVEYFDVSGGINIDMQTSFKTKKNTCPDTICWPTERDQPAWRHSDVREVGFLYMYPLFIVY